MWIAQISYLMTVTARIAAQVSFQHLWSLSSWNHLHTEQVTYTRCVMCNNIQFGALWYELLLNEWQPRITRRYSHEKNVSNKKEHFSLTLVCATTHHGAPKSALLSANPSSCAGQPASLHPERWVTGLRPLMGRWGGAPLNMKELYLPLAGGLSVSELIRTDPNNSSNVDEPSMRLGADTWRNMVGGGPFSGLWSIKAEMGLEVLLGHIS